MTRDNSFSRSCHSLYVSDDDPLTQLEALARDPRLRVAPEQRPAIVAEILHHLMWPYFLNRTPEMREKFSEANYRAFMRALEGYCLREYIEHPEPRLTLDFIKGLHRQFYSNAASVPVKAVDGSMTTMVPGEFKTVPVFIRKHAVPGEHYESTPPERVAIEMETLLSFLHDNRKPLFERYARLVADFALIHPFPDSNGKVYMLLCDLFLLGYGVRPPLYAKLKWENTALFYAIGDDYYSDQQRDLMRYYDLIVAAYRGSGLLDQKAYKSTGA